MHFTVQAIICAVRPHGEHGAIVRAMTADHGLLGGYVRGGRSRTMRPVLMPSNLVMAEYRARTEDQLAGMTAELVHSRAPLMAEPLAAAKVDFAVLVGPEMAALASELGKGAPGALGKRVRFAHCETPEQAVAALEDFGLSGGDAVLVKGSNSVGLARLIAHFTSASSEV